MTSFSPLENLIEFGPFECDVVARELRRKGHRVKIQEQPFEVLTMLLSAGGAVISREDFRSALWPADTFVDFDNGLNRAVSKLREVLGDNPANPKYIATVARHGYRFIATTGAPQRVAVLPIVDLSEGGDCDPFADGLSEEIIGQLATLDPHNVRVIARTSVMRYKGTRQSAFQIGRELNVNYILEGSVRRSSSRIRIAVQLVSVKDDEHVWSDFYDCEVDDWLSAQSNIGSRLRSSLNEYFSSRALVRPIRAYKH